ERTERYFRLLRCDRLRVFVRQFPHKAEYFTTRRRSPSYSRVPDETHRRIVPNTYDFLYTQRPHQRRRRLVPHANLSREFPYCSHLTPKIWCFERAHAATFEYTRLPGFGKCAENRSHQTKLDDVHERSPAHHNGIALFHTLRRLRRVVTDHLDTRGLRRI